MSPASSPAGHYLYNGISGFTQKGTYTIRSVFDGNETLYGSASDLKTILVGSSAGYAVIVEGKISNNEGLASHNKTANRIYKKHGSSRKAIIRNQEAAIGTFGG